MLARQPLHHLAAAKILFALGRQVQLMPAPRELGDRGLVVAEVGEVPRDEENLHAWSVRRHGTRTARSSRSHDTVSTSGVMPEWRAATSTPYTPSSTPCFTRL